MSRSFLPLVGISFLFVSCAKTMGGDEPVTYTIKVKEHKTNIPLSGVAISLYRCSNYDFVFGCQAKSKFATYTTDSKGEAVIPDKDYSKANEGIILSRSQYWEIQGGQGDNFMLPEAWVKVALKASKNYPDTTMFELRTEGEFGIKSILTVRAPKDSVLDFRLIGNAANKIDWIAFPRMGPCLFYCPRDSLAVGSLIVNPNKFETINAAITY